ncbi:hypothetical protein DMN91_010006 [Ooceraea biroi]|uniref:Odorant receptor n=1 Tax=Ooceraea biroi TaxID=2015173 RepID=A0A026VYT9_OOCBI|nr:uncharacterized protein LOC105285094 [Ooceraea biroi]EZA48942.1 hypothetical protein X777_12905 [Ooceraea biroi]RLU17769.1 hypothetical protein DMN91_010006 [Ooceraea biroi]
MHEIEEHYYKINRNFLKMLGLWPYQQSLFARLRKVLFIGILFGYIVAQFLSFVTMQFSANLLLKILSFVSPTLYVTMKYCLFVVQTDNVKRLLEQIRNDWELVKDKLEIDIIKKYAGSVRFISMCALVFCHCDTLCYITLQFLPLILDVILPLNESRSLKLIVITEYFVNREKYLWLMLLHEIVAIYLRVITICCTTTTIMMYILHACALFKVASYRMENAIQEDMLAMCNPVQEYLLYQKIASVVIIHRRAIAYVELWISSFTMVFTILIVIGISSISFSLFHLLQVITNTSNDYTDMYAAFISVVAQFTYMFIINYCGEIVQNHGMQVFEATYNGLWYAAPLRAQKLILFVMQRAIVKVNLTFGNIFILSLEGFVTLASKAVSYFTVIYSTRQ